MTTNEVVHNAALQLPGIGLSDTLIQEAVEMCEREMNKVAVRALRVVVARHLATLSTPKKPSRKQHQTVLDNALVQSEG